MSKEYIRKVLKTEEYAEDLTAVNPNKLKKKGEKNGLCNRSACLSPRNVIFFNRETGKYYCDRCARKLNDSFAMEPANLYDQSKPLCLTDEGLTPPRGGEKP